MIIFIAENSTEWQGDTPLGLCGAIAALGGPWCLAFAFEQAHVYEIVFFALKSYAGHPGSYSFNALMGSLQFFLGTQHWPQIKHPRPCLSNFSIWRTPQRWVEITTVTKISTNVRVKHWQGLCLHCYFLKQCVLKFRLIKGTCISPLPPPRGPGYQQENWNLIVFFRLCTMTLTRLELLKPLEPSLTEVIISVSMQVNE